MAQNPAAVPDSLASPVLYRPGEAASPRIDRGEVLRYLGYAGQEMDRDLRARIERIVSDLERAVSPRGVRRVFSVDATGFDAAGEPCIRLAGSTIELRGRDIFRHLKDAGFCAVMACTLGMESERRLRGGTGGSPLDTAILDAAASAYVEAAVDEMDAALGCDAAEAGLGRNRRFSCGYGDCPLDAQDAIVRALDARRLIGLTVTGSHLLVPSKSVTCVVGLIDGEASDGFEPAPCAICRLARSCAFIARGTTCHANGAAPGAGTRPTRAATCESTVKERP